MITLIIGPMFAGKSTELIKRLDRFHYSKKKVCFVRPLMDSRKNITHNKTIHNFKEFKFESITDNLVTLMEYDVIGIDEGQFFDNLVSPCDYLANRGKQVIVSGLNLSSERSSFEPIHEIIPYCEEIIKLNAVCSECCNDYGSFTYCKVNKTSELMVGDGDQYTSVCRDCYNKLINN